MVAERRSRGEGKDGGQETFHPVKTDLSLDTAVELYKQPQGRWGVRGGRAIPASAAWLAGDGFDALNAAPFQPGFRQIGSRECCVGEVMIRGKASETSAPVLVERVLGPDPAADRYRLVNADLGRGDAVELVDGPARSDPFATEVLRRIERVWVAGQGREIAEAAALNALQAGASVDAAVALPADLLPRGGKDLGPAAAPTYAAAGAAAGAAQRAGLPAETAAAMSPATPGRMAEYLHDRPAAVAAAYAGAARRPCFRMPGRMGCWREPTCRRRRNSGPRSSVVAHAMAGARLAAAQAEVAAQDRQALGPELSAINAAARELLIEKKIPAEGLAAVAARAAEKRVALVREQAEEVSAEAAKTQGRAGPRRGRDRDARGGSGQGVPRGADQAAIQASLDYERGKQDELAATLLQQQARVDAADRELAAVSGDAGPRHRRRDQGAGGGQCRGAGRAARRGRRGQGRRSGDAQRRRRGPGGARGGRRPSRRPGRGG